MTMTGPKISKALLTVILISVITTGSVYVESATVNKARSGVESAGQKIDSSMNKVGNFMDDSTITTKVEVALVDHGDVKSIDIPVKTDQKVVTLSGFVEGQAQAEEAMKVAKGVEDVTSVSDKLHMRDSKDTSIRGYAGDMATTSEVKVKLPIDDIVPSRKAKVETTNGAAQLSGTVDPQAQSDRTESTAEAINGAKSVRNDLRTQ